MGNPDSRLLHALVDAGIRVNSVTLVEPNVDHFEELLGTVEKMKEVFTTIEFFTQNATLEDFSTEEGRPERFHFIIANQIFYYLKDKAKGFQLLTRELLHRNGRAIISSQLPAGGLFSLNQELCNEHGFEDNYFLMHMGIIENYANINRVLFERELLSANLDVTPIFAAKNEGGHRLLSFMINNNVQNMKPEAVEAARRAVRHYAHPDPERGATRLLFPQDIGVMTAYGIAQNL